MTQIQEAQPGTAVIATFNYDNLGRRTTLVRGNGGTTTYTYDAASRLASLSNDVAVGGSANDQVYSFAYSPASQLTVRTAQSSLYDWPYSQAFSDTYASNGLNQYTTVAGANLTYDGRGNTINDTTKSYEYDSSNRLTRVVGGATLEYDPLGRLWAMTPNPADASSRLRYLYDGVHRIGEYNTNGNTVRRFVFSAPDDPVLWYEGTGVANKRWLYKDERKSVVAVEINAASVTINKYDEYGQPASGNLGQFQYTGQIWQPELALYNYKARHYSPDLGRFMQTDPIGYEDQMGLYAYVANDPVNKNDPTGMQLAFAQPDRTPLQEIMDWLDPRMTPEAVEARGGSREEVHAAYRREVRKGIATDLVETGTTIISAQTFLLSAPQAAARQSPTIAAYVAARTALIFNSAQVSYKGSTVVGHALSKHAGRNPHIWGKLTGPTSTWGDKGMAHLKAVMDGPGQFVATKNKDGILFLEKRLQDGRGVRLNMDGSFKGFID